ncbi:MAG: hypothetical protein R6U50_09000 [Desulfobacterales bacterium]
MAEFNSQIKKSNLIFIHNQKDTPWFQNTFAETRKEIDDWWVCPHLVTEKDVQLQHDFYRMLFVFPGFVVCELCCDFPKISTFMTKKDSAFLSDHVLKTPDHQEHRYVCNHILEQDTLEKLIFWGHPLIWQNGRLICRYCLRKKFLGEPIGYTRFETMHFNAWIIHSFFSHSSAHFVDLPAMN